MQNSLKIFIAVVVLTVLSLIAYQGTVYQIEHPEMNSEIDYAF